MNYWRNLLTAIDQFFNAMIALCYILMILIIVRVVRGGRE